MITWLLGLDRTISIEKAEFFLASTWAREGPFWLFLALATAAVAAGLYYHRFQQRGGAFARSLLGLVRGLLLVLLIVTLANPFLRVTVDRLVMPTVYLLFDGTESMLTEDVLAADFAPDVTGDSYLSRLEAIRGMLIGDYGEAFAGLAGADCRIEAFLFHGRTTNRLRKLVVDEQPSTERLRDVAAQLSASGQVTALGAVVEEMALQRTARHATAVVLFSDFAHNSGPLPTTGQYVDALRSIGLPTFTVGVGRPQLTDLAVDLQVEPRMKIGEQSKLLVTLRPSDLVGRTAEVRLHATRIDAASQAEQGASQLLGVHSTVLTSDAIEVPFTFVPRQTGLWGFTATAAMIAGEVALENNEAARQTNVIDDYLRMLYIAYEPNWEWRFVKEALHRDRLVGMEGFRTYLESSDPRVRRGNVLFLESLPTRKSELFRNDLILLDDVAASSLTGGVDELLEEYVGRMGGGLVILAGPRFPLGDLADTSLATMLPVIVDSGLGLRDETEFQPQLTSEAKLFSFMDLAESAPASREAWHNMGKVPWYQPVADVHEQAFVLCEHPADECRSGRRQPLIAVRRYGKGEVVFVAFNELWRLRRGHGETYHRRFWSQLVYRLGMSHALGDEKRFVVRTDRTTYRVDDLVTLSVDAYDAGYEPLDAESVADGSLTGTLAGPLAGTLAGTPTLALSDGGSAPARELVVPWLKNGVFETRFTVPEPGRYLVRVTDPITNEQRAIQFEASGATAERRNPVRNVQIQQDLASVTGGRAYELKDLRRLVEDLSLDPIVESDVRTRPLWNTPVWFLSVTILMIGEWLVRRWIHLR
jgi:hypothetical protein